MNSIQITEIYKNILGGLEIIAIGDVPKIIPGFIIGIEYDNNQNPIRYILVPYSDPTKNATEQALLGDYQSVISLIHNSTFPKINVVITYKLSQPLKYKQH
ncbi:MAG: hypothetical protein QXR96_01460 [Candidatus Woesearchaeota archaeon]